MKASLIRPLLEVAVVLFVVLSAARWLTGLFSKRPHIYQATAARQLRLLFWPLLALGAGLSVLPAAAFSEKASAFEWMLSGGFLIFTLALSGPALLLHLRYWLLNREMVLVFQPDENRLEVYDAGQRVPFERRNLAGIERVTCSARRTFWYKYDYLRLNLTDGRSVVLTSLLTELAPLEGFLRNLPITRRASAWCWV